MELDRLDDVITRMCHCLSCLWTGAKVHLLIRGKVAHHTIHIHRIKFSLYLRVQFFDERKA